MSQLMKNKVGQQVKPYKKGGISVASNLTNPRPDIETTHKGMGSIKNGKQVAAKKPRKAASVKVDQMKKGGKC